MNGRRMLAAGAAAAGLVLAGAAGAAFAAERRARRWFSFRGKVALVTGGSRGLGLVLARQLARAGARVAICARDEAELARARAQIAAAGDGAGGA
ncbi:MAG TPA: SDR family NAD(P)-dependent oxidoreductase, partial [Gemmatimonadales bacterium]|nr:SDR family NAD(P)-dependent oxidoreductase [Gemmatimonadales bacterium]